jgi:hypothetical protein
MPAPSPKARKDFSNKTPVTLKKVQWVRVRRNLTARQDDSKDLRGYVTRLTGGSVIIGDNLKPISEDEK